MKERGSRTTGAVRLAVALLVTALGLWLCRDDIASLLVTRGDTFYRATQLDDAIDFYGRALRVSHWYAPAALRLMTLQCIGKREPKSILAMANAFVAKYPDDVELHRSRAVCNTVLLRYRDAIPDWNFVAHETALPNEREQAAFFAGISYVRLGRRADAQRYIPIVDETNHRLAAVLKKQAR